MFSFETTLSRVEVSRIVDNDLSNKPVHEEVVQNFEETLAFVVVKRLQT